MRQLAKDADADVEEVLVALWEARIGDIADPDDYIPSALLRRARATLGIETVREQKRVSYWLTRTGLTRSQLTTFLAELGIILSPKSRTLPKGALSKLRRRFAFFSADGTATKEAPSELPPCPDLIWEPVGHVKEVICYLSEDEVRHIHEALVVDFAAADDPISPAGVKSEHLLSSALTRPLTSLGGERKYPTIELAAAALLHSLVQNHPFHNGNKRTAVVAMLVFLDANGILATCDEHSLFKFLLRVAQHSLVPLHCTELADREVMEIAGWIRSNSRLIEKGERPIPWLKVKRILREFDCDYGVVSGGGNRINLWREVKRRQRFGRSSLETLSIQVAYGDDGRTVQRNTLNAIRRALELDESHGVDSRAFYEAETLPDDFIQQYRMLLRRLARV